MMPTKSTKPAPAARKARPSRKPATATTPAIAEVPADLIARRAYELFVEDGAQHGRDLEHWLRAERELLSAS